MSPVYSRGPVSIERNPLRASRTLFILFYFFILGNRTNSVLRYGFHQIKECKNFALAYLCMTKCLDLNYDVATSDKHCKCTCFYKKDKKKFTINNMPTRTYWKLGAPSTATPGNKKKNVKLSQNVDESDEDTNEDGQKTDKDEASEKESDNDSAERPDGDGNITNIDSHDDLVKPASTNISVSNTDDENNNKTNLQTPNNTTIVEEKVSHNNASVLQTNDTEISTNNDEDKVKDNKET